jgi:DNA-binding response OmpR family regulator
MKILLADDDPVSLQLIRDFLSKAGHRVEVCDNGERALDILSGDEAPQLALLDWMMPELSGLEVCQQLGRTGTRADRYIIILSGRNRKKDIAEGLLAGADDYLVKPVDLTELIARVRVAERTLAAHNELRRHVEQLEQLARRHNLLGELAVRRNANPLAERPLPRQRPDDEQARHARSILSQQVANLHGILVVGQLFEEMLREMGVDAKLRQPSANETPDELEPPLYLAWTPVLLPRQSAWLDLVLEAGEQAARSLAQTLLKDNAARGTKAPFDVLTLDAFAEAAGMGVSKLRGQFDEDHIPARMPLLTRAGHFRESPLRRRPPSRLLLHLHAGEAVFQLSVFEYRAPEIVKTLLELIEMDVLTEDLVPESEGAEPLLKAWEALTAPAINRARNWIEDGLIADSFPVMQPSPAARDLAAKLRS